MKKIKKVQNQLDDCWNSRKKVKLKQELDGLLKDRTEVIEMCGPITEPGIIKIEIINF